VNRSARTARGVLLTNVHSLVVALLAFMDLAASTVSFYMMYACSGFYFTKFFLEKLND